MKPPIPKAFPFRRTFEDEQVHVYLLDKRLNIAVYTYL